ncbi:MAG TPA: Fur family transcriptional regulator [Anaerolineae bacterium]|nr:Fur family transcriptional regulator [Anaerolineae bacterium]
MTQHVELVRSLRQAGHRLTPQRESVLATVAESDGHITAEEILERVRARYPYLNKSAVYRSLDLLAELGIVTQTDLGHGRVEYELHRHPHHHHLICRQCKSVKQIDHKAFVSLQRQLESDFGFKPDLDHFAIFGVCRKCQGRRTKSSKRHTH